VPSGDGTTKKPLNLQYNRHFYVLEALDDWKSIDVLTCCREETWKDILSLLREKFSDVEASKLDLLFGLMLLASKKKDEIVTNYMSAYYKANVKHTLKFVSDTVR
jgi:hypothetical protein